MSISVSEAMALEQFHHLTLVAGQKGLERPIERIGVLDYEIVEGIRGDFFPGDFVLTSFTAARGDIQLVKSCIEDLISCKVSALAIKTIYYQTLPEEILALADYHGLPIFLFDRSVCFEYIIEDLMDALHARSRMGLLASKVDILFQNRLKSSDIRQLALEINRHFKESHVCVYFKEKGYTHERNTLKLAERYQRSTLRPVHHTMIKYQEGLLFVLTSTQISDKAVNMDIFHVMKQLGMKNTSYAIGISESKSSLDLLDRSVKEAIYAAESGILEENERQHYREMGIYKLLLPYKDDPWLKDFSTDILTPIKDYDQGKLMETAEMYILQSGDIKKTSEALFQHINTIRYRLNKMQSLIGVTSHGDFYEQLSVAIKINKIIRSKK